MHDKTRASGTRRRHGRTAAFTLVELLIAVAIILTLAAMAVPSLLKAMDIARIARAVGEIRTLEDEIALYESLNDRLPDSLNDIGRGTLLDPWGTPYQYLNFANVKGKGAMRKDRFLVPLNSTYDLYSMGPDRLSQPPLTAKVSRDDIVRANDGGFIGPASAY